MKTRNGKIARLPRDIREQLNQRLESCAQSPDLLVWLNARPEVRSVLKDDFNGEPISKQNLSQWRQGGYQDWLAMQDLRAGLGNLDEFTADMDEGRDVEIADQVATILMARFAGLLSRWDGECNAAFEAKSRVFNRLCRSVVQLQRQMHWASRDNLEMENLIEKQDKDRDTERRERLVRPFFDMLKVKPMADLFGGGAHGEKLASFILAVQGNRLESAEAIIESFNVEAGKKKAPEKPPNEKTASKRSKPLEKNEIAAAYEDESGAPESKSVKASQSDLSA